LAAVCITYCGRRKADRDTKLAYQQEASGDTEGEQSMNESLFPQEFPQEPEHCPLCGCKMKSVCFVDGIVNGRCKGWQQVMKHEVDGSVCKQLQLQKQRKGEDL
jgi:hypothetical protein